MRSMLARRIARCCGPIEDIGTAAAAWEILALIIWEAHVRVCLQTQQLNLLNQGPARRQGS